jgi:hypothetical protein
MEKEKCKNCNSFIFLKPYNPRFLKYCPNRAMRGYFINNKFIEEGEVMRYGIKIQEPYVCNKCGTIKK